MRLFTDAAEDACNQRPDIFLRSPRGLGRQTTIDVAVTGVDGISRTSDEAAKRPLQARYDQKMAKHVAMEGLSSNSNDSEANFQDLGHNADLYTFNQDDRQD